MSIKEMKKLVFEANLDLPKNNLVKLTWGNVSLIDRDLGVIVIKPSGVPYKTMKESDMVVTDLDGNPLPDQLKPSSDLPTHVLLYKHFKTVNSIVHTHSKFAVAFAQSGLSIDPYGTTHADTFYGSIPCARSLTKEEVNSNYEVETGNVIIEKFNELNISPDQVPAINTKNHGPFIFGKTTANAIENTIILEEVAEMAFLTKNLQSSTKSINQYLLDKHYLRKHGEKAYYGQQ
ncbi:L-ribulose-5-phosphate 4-epimerase AraD [Staphylococcus simulans]|uniref:L-ribulose-5-phosphate 4-epimerase AraD n=1 Tax=Staphylococcus simulans TaxID=1286 RepID=UPI000D02E634|nr:L-ribulose-5-phosphate 4-epimerase AraD [Staphylococcus simulans]